MAYTTRQWLELNLAIAPTEKDTGRTPASEGHFSGVRQLYALEASHRRDGGELVLTTGTGGGIGKEWEVGDVIVSPIVRFAVNQGKGKKPKLDPTITCRTA